jgi:hypothetical protein
MKRLKKSVDVEGMARAVTRADGGLALAGIAVAGLRVGGACGGGGGDGRALTAPRIFHGVRDKGSAGSGHVLLRHHLTARLYNAISLFENARLC